MDIVVLLALIGLMLVVGALMLFAFTVRARDYQFADKISLMPFEDDTSNVLKDKTKDSPIREIT